MQTTYNTTGAYVLFGGFIVAALAHFGFVVQQSDIIQVIAGIATLIGAIMQTVNHSAVAKAAGLK